MPGAITWRRLGPADVAVAEHHADAGNVILPELSGAAVEALCAAHPVVVVKRERGYDLVGGARSLAVARATLGDETRLWMAVCGDTEWARAIELADRLLAPTVLAVPDAVRARRWSAAADGQHQLEPIGLAGVDHNQAARYAGLSRSRYYRLRSRATPRTRAGTNEQ